MRCRRWHRSSHLRRFLRRSRRSGLGSISAVDPVRALERGWTYDDAFRAVVDGVVERIVLHILVRVEDVDSGDGGDVAHVESGLTGGHDGRVKEVRLVGDDGAEVAHLDGLEGVHGVGVCLGDVVRGHNAVVHDDQRTTVARSGVRGDGHGLEEVERAVGGDGGCGPHGADDDDGLAAVDCSVEEEGRLLERVGAVRDDGAAQGGVVADDLVDGPGHVEQKGRRHVGAADIGDLDAGHVSNV